MREIQSISNPTIKGIKKLQRKKDRWDERLYLIEGVKVINEYMEYIGKPKLILISEELSTVTGGTELFNKINEYDAHLIKVPHRILKDLSDTENPQGIVAVVNFNDSEIENLIVEKNNFIIVLDGVQDPGNLGTIIRSADAFNINGIILTDNCVDLYNPKVVRGTMGSLFHIPIAIADNKLEIINNLKDRGITIYSTYLEGKNYIHKIDMTKDMAIIIGNESRGVSKELLELSDYTLKIPMYGNAESLNAAIAASVIMYEAARQRVNI